MLRRKQTHTAELEEKEQFSDEFTKKVGDMGYFGINFFLMKEAKGV